MVTPSVRCVTQKTFNTDAWVLFHCSNDNLHFDFKKVKNQNYLLPNPSKLELTINPYKWEENHVLSFKQNDKII